MSLTLSAVAPARHSALVDTAEALTCPACDSAMKLTPNPYFGTGLAAHRNIALCGGCPNIAFVPEAEPVVVSAGDRFADVVRSLLRRR
jgi:hypothetical protein